MATSTNSPAGIDQRPYSRTYRRQPVVGIRECSTRSIVHAHRTYAGGYRCVCGSLDGAVLGEAQSVPPNPMNWALPPFTMAHTNSSAHSTLFAASCIGSLHPDLTHRFRAESCSMNALRCGSSRPAAPVCVRLPWISEVAGSFTAPECDITAIGCQRAAFLRCCEAYFAWQN
jgi:hypothetical protein